MRLGRKLTVFAGALLLAATGVSTAAEPRSGQEYKEDEQQLRAQLAAAELAQGPDADATLSLMGQLGLCLQHQRKNKEAEPILRTLVARREKTQPVGSPVTARAYVLLAYPLTDLEKYDEALVLCEKAQRIYENIGAVANEELANALVGIGAVKLGQNKPGEAEVFFRKGLELQTAAKVSEDDSIASTLDRLAGALSEIGRLQKDDVRMKEAEEMMRRALAITEKTLGDHPKTAIRLNSLSNHLTTMGRLPEAEQLLRRALAISFKLFGDAYPDTIVYLLSLSDSLKRLGRYKEAEPFIVRAIDGSVTFYGAEHVDTAYACHNYGRLLMALSRVDEAKASFEHALAIREKVLGPDHLDVGKSLYNLASVEVIQGNYATAEKMCRRVLAIDEKAYGLVHLEVASDLEMLSDVLVRESKFKAAEDVQYRVMSILFEIVGRQHWRSLDALDGLSHILTKQSRYAEAEALMQQHTEEVARAVGENHPSVARCNVTMAFVYALTDRVNEAEAECRKALIILAADEKRNGVTNHMVEGAVDTYTSILMIMGYGGEQVRTRIELIRKGSNPGPPPPVQVRANPRKVS